LTEDGFILNTGLLDAALIAQPTSNVKH
jgi:hypothetical protein